MLNGGTIVPGDLRPSYMRQLQHVAKNRTINTTFYSWQHVAKNRMLFYFWQHVAWLLATSCLEYEGL